MRILLVALTLLAAAPLHAACIGDCDGDGDVAVAELIGLIGCALDPLPVERPCVACPAADAMPQTISTLIAAVNNALNGCPRERFRVTVRVGERPGATGYSRGGTVTLQPLGLTRGNCCLPEPDFVFEDVPPGEYTVSYGSTCNPFGCFVRDVPVRVVDTDAYAYIPIRPGCRADADCLASGGACIPPGGSPGCGICRDDPDECSGDDTCPPDFVCVDAPVPPCPCDGTPARVCIPRCTFDDACAARERCLGGRCVRDTCAGDADCVDAGVCVVGACYDAPGTCQLPPP